ncbi:MAG TPA: retropepsin-like aspartic protease [Burkholderiales bacterium]|nr:retropepsin-like aspartic protease [Burkholderiales bacterium]
MRRIPAQIALAILLSACELSLPTRSRAPADTAAGEIAFRLASPNEAAILVPVQINGRSAIDFVLDTGATLSCIDVSLARELQLPDDDAIGGIAVGAMNVGRLETVRIDSLRIGNAVVYDVAACKLDLEVLRRGFGAHGLIGLNFLKSFDMQLDFDRNVLTLTAPD